MKYIYILSLILITSCASLSDKATKLTIYHNKEKVVGCKAVGKVFSSSSGGSDVGFILLGKRNAEIKMKNIAAEMGDTLLITKQESDLLGSDHEGRVYRCKKW